MTCATCTHLHKPGRAEPGYCGGRADLEPAYGANHPLKKLPADHGKGCKDWKGR